MATTRKKKTTEAGVEQLEQLDKAANPMNPMDTPERFKMSSIGYSGLRLFDGVVQTELVDDLKFPKCNETYRKMLLHPSINAPINLHKQMAGKATYRVLEPKDATQEEKRLTAIVSDMLFKDMEHGFDDFIADAMTMLDYGFAPIEKVYRQRTTSSGSLYNDGLIGIRKLGLRNQLSIEKFLFDADGETVIGVKQDLTLLSDPYNRFTNKSKTTVNIPRSKFMLITAGDNRQNPFGTSPLRNVYISWKYLQAIEELEASGVSKDLQGLPILSVPAEYMSAEASPEKKQAYMNFQNLVRNIQMNSQSGVVLPMIYDPETRQPMFKLELLSNSGRKVYDTEKIKEYYRAMIFIGLSADVLLQGVTSTGSHNVGMIKNSLTAQAVEAYIKRIVDVVNKDLIRSIYERNGWDASRACMLDYEGFHDLDAETYFKSIQRVSAVGMLPKTLDVINANLRMLGIDELDSDTTQEELEEMLTPETSRSGDGLTEGLPGGVGSNVGLSGNDSDLNADNSA